MLNRLIFLTIVLTLTTGCTVENLYLYPATEYTSTDEQWTYGRCDYALRFEVTRDLYESVTNCARPAADADFGELVQLASGPGLSDVEILAADVADMTPSPATPRRTADFIVSFVRSLSSDAAFDYRAPLYYPLEVAMDGGNSSADLTALSAAMLNTLNYRVGIAVFWDECCPSDIHVALGIAGLYPVSHGVDDTGTEWVFAETTAGNACSEVGCRPAWLDSYADWLVWPLWEASSSVTKARHVTKSTMVVPQS